MRARLLNVHAHTSECASKHTAVRALHIKSCGCCFFHAVGCADIGGGPSNAPKIQGPEGRICAPPGAPSPAQRRHRKNGLNSAQVSGRPVDRVVKVVRGPGEDLQDAVEGCFRLLPAQADGQSAVRPRNGVGNVRLRGYPIKGGPPGVSGRQRPEGGEEAIDCRVGHSPCLAPRIVNKRHPIVAEDVGEGDHRQDLCQDL